MNRQTPQRAVKFTKSAEVLAYEIQSPGLAADQRERDRRPGRFTVRGSFVELPGSRQTNGTKASPPYPVS